MKRCLQIWLALVVVLFMILVLSGGLGVYIAVIQYLLEESVGPIGLPISPSPKDLCRMAGGSMTDPPRPEGFGRTWSGSCLFRSASPMAGDVTNTNRLNLKVFRSRQARSEDMLSHVRFSICADPRETPRIRCMIFAGRDQPFHAILVSTLSGEFVIDPHDLARRLNADVAVWRGLALDTRRGAEPRR